MIHTVATNELSIFGCVASVYNVARQLSEETVVNPAMVEHWFYSKNERSYRTWLNREHCADGIGEYFDLFTHNNPLLRQFPQRFGRTMHMVWYVFNIGDASTFSVLPAITYISRNTLPAAFEGDTETETAGKFFLYLEAGYNNGNRIISYDDVPTNAPSFQTGILCDVVGEKPTFYPVDISHRWHRGSVHPQSIIPTRSTFLMFHPHYSNYADTNKRNALVRPFIDYIKPYLPTYQKERNK